MAVGGVMNSGASSMYFFSPISLSALPSTKTKVDKNEIDKDFQLTTKAREGESTIITSIL
jgi:hypothetical protein